MKTKKALNLPPSPPEREPVLAHARLLSKDIIGYIENNFRKYDGIFRIETPIRSLVVITKPEYIEYVLRENNRNYTKSFAYETLKLLLGRGLLTSEGDLWKRQRRLIQPSFHKQKIEGYFLQMVHAADELIDRLKKSGPQNPINITREMNRTTLDIVARALFGKPLEKETEIVRENLSIANEFAIRRIKKILKPPTWFPNSENRSNNKALKALNDVVMGMIDERKRNPEAYDDLLSLLILARDEETGEAMSNEQLRDEVMTILLAGHETSAIALNWLWYLVSVNPEVEEKLVSETDRVFSNELTMQDLRKLAYVTHTIEETLRLYPPAYLVGRAALTADKIGGFDILPGTNIVLAMYIVHRDPEIWGSDATDFIPERFERSSVRNLQHFAYFPFGGGPRLCIGQSFAMMEMQVIATKLIQAFHFKLAEGFKPETSHLITLRMKHDLMVKPLQRVFSAEKIHES